MFGLPQELCDETKKFPFQGDALVPSVSSRIKASQKKETGRTGREEMGWWAEVDGPRGQTT